MPEIISDKKVFSLSEVLVSVQKTLATRYSSAFWVKAEMNKLNYYRHSGHCYPDLVDKVEGKIIAESRAILWNTDYNRINRKFQTILKEPLKDGIKILFSARVQFDPKYGLSLLILDIDPSFTLGDLEREKQETLQRLKSENRFDKNKLLKLPLLPQRIAIISVETSKGYADFLNVISGNPWKYRFFHLLFPSLLQGERAATSIIAQLRKIKKAVDHFDVVAIIRGGGGEVGLSCYNNYELAKFISEFPIPVITGIGHATNETVSEMVSHTNAITPTKLAEFLIQHFHNFSNPVKEAQQKIIDRSRRLIEENKTEFKSITRLFRSVSSKTLISSKHEVNNMSRLLGHQAFLLFIQNKEVLKNIHRNITVQTGFHLHQAKSQIESLENNMRILHPDNVLRRGYSITLLNGKSLTEVSLLKKSDVVETLLASGSFTSIVSQTNIKPEENE